MTFLPPVGVPSTLMMIVTLDDKGAPLVDDDPTLAATYTTEDVLWTYGVTVAVTQALSDLVMVTVPIDIKAMRRVTNGHDLRMTLRSTGPAAASWTVNGALRSLVRKSG